ncbi:Decarbamoylnovobiocin carbamoyltransferase [Usitatibacter rugosus]|uniref:Decarbamoylnovobiocin carbamoyltransferase n=1 Tax=Usitatibacter rugosus TaxID=2732067 RepID=A0A6M4H1I6_9PROT|nr:carbamoyltransferase C-terminal domain-containing protein [Usitatibacter rugosus]QJR11727.1 Decarbamoylnovobiocin carbamoyltransferase [Usitatibacter rugosus]
MNILGLNAYHGDASACLLRDGKLVAAAEEERFRRIKHWAGFPSQAIAWCLKDAGLSLSDIDHVAINQDSGANLWRKLAFTLKQRPDISLVLDRLKNKRKRTGVAEELSTSLGQPFKGEVHYVEHHHAHLGSAFLVSPFPEAVAVSVDGFGDFASAAWGIGRGDQVEVDDKVYFPHSLGIFYESITQFIGFPHYGDEYKVMGLAPYGEPKYLPEMRRIVRLQDDGRFELNLDYFRHHREKVEYEWDNGQPIVGSLFSDALIELLGSARGKDDPLEQRHKDIARSAQAMYEEAFFHLVTRLHEKYHVDALALAGGCAMNSVANGKVLRNSPYKKLYVQAAAGDAGGALGAALITHRQQAGGSSARSTMDHAFWGPHFSDEEIGALVTRRSTEIAGAGCTIEQLTDEQVLVDRAAACAARGDVLGWFQGRMEWGPRALGNRSIVCDPRRADMKDILNQKIKRRESFRPFAPSILREATAEWFETDDDVPFMMQVYQIRAEKRGQIPAVTHVDGSGRLQTVTRAANPRYYALIESFRALTGVPMVLNTSFNENEPVVCRPEEALDCFLRTRMDTLVMGTWVLTRS